MTRADILESCDGIGFPNASGVERTPQALALYLERLIAPDYAAAVRRRVCKNLKVMAVKKNGALLAELNESEPAIVTALLELRIGRAYRLIQDRFKGRSFADSESAFTCRCLVAEISRIRVAYVLNMIAQDCARQVQAPCGWDVLDRIDEPAGFGTPRTGPLVRRIKSEQHTAQRVFQLYIGNTSTHEKVALRADRAAEKSRTFQNSASTATKEFVRSLGLEEPACKQLPIWRAQHGDNLEPLLDRTIKRMQRDNKQLGIDP